MATLPTTGDDLDLVSFTVETQPSDTYKLDIEHNRVRGMTDEQDAVRQAIYLILNVERCSRMTESPLWTAGSLKPAGIGCWPGSWPIPSSVKSRPKRRWQSDV